MKHTEPTKVVGYLLTALPCKVLFVGRYRDIILPIILLLFGGCPSNIRQFIVPVNINTVYSPVPPPRLWAWGHIFGKVFKRMPSFAHLNTATTVVVISMVITIVAPLQHSIPHRL